MCLIIYKPVNVPFPGIDVLEMAEIQNPDGIVFMTVENGKVVGRKGIKNTQRLSRLLSRIPIHQPAIVHFRFATHGSVSSKAAHPFPVSADKKMLTATFWESDIGVAHNGIIANFGAKAGQGLSDTQEFIKGVMADKIIRPALRHPAVLGMIEVQTHSKFAIMHFDGHVDLVGHFLEDRGCHYSNDSYLPETELVWSDYFDSGKQDLGPCVRCKKSSCGGCEYFHPVD